MGSAALNGVLPEGLVQQVIGVALPTTAEADDMIWTPTSSGEFTISSAYQIVRKEGTRSCLFTSLWHRALSSKISFFMLRLLYGRLPLMDVLQKFGILGPSRCFCCNLSSSPETINHIFYTGEVVSRSEVALRVLLAGFVRLSRLDIR